MGAALGPLNLIGILGSFKYMSLPSKEVTPEIVLKVISSMGLPTATPEVAKKISDVIRNDDTETVAQWLGTPEKFQKLRKMLKREDPNSVVRCPHCNELIALTVDMDDIPTAKIEAESRIFAASDG